MSILTRTRQIVPLSFALLLLGGCASPSLTVQSVPEGAEVVGNKLGSPPVKLGKTPVRLSPDTAGDLFGDNLQLGISKDGFVPEELVVQKEVFGANATVQVQLKENHGQVAACPSQDQIINEVAQSVAESQKLVARKDYSGGKQYLTSLVGKYPNVAVFHVLLGNINYLEHNLQGALESYRRAKEIQPDNAEIARMIEKLSAIHGGKEKGGQ